MNRYEVATANDTRKAMTLYRRNLQLSQELFTVISCFEIALRNRIDVHYQTTLGPDWLRQATLHGGMFNHHNMRFTRDEIQNGLRKIGAGFTHYKLVAELGFGFWRYMFAANQFAAAGRTLLRIMPSKPRSTPAIQYNHIFVFNELAKTNSLRNRIAHHEPVCFRAGSAIVDTTYVRQQYQVIMQLFQWMNIDERDLLYGLDHVLSVCDELDTW
jgi:hypothetical protein